MKLPVVLYFVCIIISYQGKWNMREGPLNDKSEIKSKYSLSCQVNFAATQTARVVLCNNRQQKDGTNEADVEKLMLAYLKALKKFDHEGMKKYIHPQMNFPDSLMRKYRAFEKATKTKWKYSIQRINGDSVFVYLSENSLFYDAIGVGTRVADEVYTIKDGLVYTNTTLSRKPSTQQYLKALNDFQQWLKQTTAGKDKRIMDKDQIIFDGTSGKLLLPWLKKYSARGH